MFLIKLDGQRIDLAPGHSTTLERYNPMFDFETVRGARVLDFDVPFSDVNNRLFNWYYRPQSEFPNRDYFCEKIDEGVLIEKGFITLRDVGDDGYKLMFSQNLGEIFGDYQATTLNKIDFGGEVIPASFVADVDVATAKYALPVIQNPGFYGNEGAGISYNGYVNHYTAGAYAAGGPMVPMLFLRHLFELIGEVCDFRFTGDFFTSDVYRRALVYNTFSLDGQTEISYANHLPEMTIPDLLRELKKLLNLSLFFDVQERLLSIRFTDVLMAQPTLLDWTDRIVPGLPRSPERANRLELDWEVDGGDALTKLPPADFEKYQTPVSPATKGGIFFAVKSKFSTLETDVLTGLAMAEQAGVSPQFNQGGNRFSPRLLLWNGMVGGLPTATNAYGSWRLAWHGPNNLVSTCWRRYEAWRGNTSNRKMAARLTAADMALVDFHRNQGEHVAIHVRGRDYYISEIRANLPLEQEVELSVWDR